jgi:hypothetical protein
MLGFLYTTSLAMGVCFFSIFGSGIMLNLKDLCAGWGNWTVLLSV